METAAIVHGRQAPPADEGGVASRGGAHVPNTSQYPVDAPPSDPLPQMDHWSDEPSLITICREVVADEVLAAIDVDPTWDAVHHVLAGHGMQIRKSGPNSWQLDAMKEDAGEIIHLPASKALRKLQLGKLAERLGEFLPAPGPLRPPAEPASRHTEAGTAPQERGPSKRDPDKRMVRRLQRAELRTSLIERYRAEKMKAVADRAKLREEGKQISVWRAAEHATLRAEFAPRRAAIQANPHLSESVKRQQYSLLAMERIQTKLRVDSLAKERRDALTASLLPIPQWRRWVEQQASAGDEAAISALRGMVYQERREAAKSARDVDLGDAPAASEADIDTVVQQILSRRRKEDAIHPAKPLPQSQAQVLLRMIEGLQWQVTSNGSIRYTKVHGEPLFTDRGNRVTFDRRLVSDDELRLTLLHAREKFGPSIVLAGTDAAFTERMVKAAAELGLQVRNPELRGLWQKHAEQTATHVKSPKPRARSPRG